MTTPPTGDPFGGPEPAPVEPSAGGGQYGPPFQPPYAPPIQPSYRPFEPPGQSPYAPSGQPPYAPSGQYPYAPPGLHSTGPVVLPTSPSVGYPVSSPPGAGPWAGPPAVAASPPKRGKPGLLIGVIGGTALLLVACVGGGALVVASKKSLTTRTAISTSPSPTVHPVTPEAYQEALASADATLTAAVQQVAAARAPKATGAAVDKLHDTLTTLTSTLRDLAPPAAMAGAHQALTRAVADFALEVSGITALVTDNRICAGVSAISKITSVPQAAAVRTAAQDLATADTAHPYKFGTFLPAVTPDTFRQLANGTFVKKGGGGGSGKFKLDNKAASDAVVSLVPAGGKTALFILYVRAGANATANGIKNGNYDVYLSEGVDWEPGIGSFTRNCGFEKFADPLAFKATSTRYDIWTITTGGSSDGTAAPANKIDPADFPTG